MSSTTPSTMTSTHLLLWFRRYGVLEVSLEVGQHFVCAAELLFSEFDALTIDRDIFVPAGVSRGQIAQ